MEKIKKIHNRLKIRACFGAYICILLVFFSIYFTPNFVANNLSPDGILEQTTISKINFIRLSLRILSTIGLLISALYMIKPNLFYLLQLKISKFLRIKIFNKKNATLFLTLLLCADFSFIVLHFISFFTPYLNYELYSLVKDRGKPELFQYIKWFWIIILLIYVSKKRRSFSYAIWAFVFTYFLFDDALRIHEEVGYYFEANLDFIPLFGLRLQDYGELAVSATVGMIFLALITWAYLNGTRAFKKVSQDLLLLILALVFFGIGVDMALIAIKLGRDVNLFLGAIEDGGEMLVATLILWYVFLQSVSDENTSLYICDYIRIFQTPKCST